MNGWRFTDSPSDPADSQIQYLIQLQEIESANLVCRSLVQDIDSFWRRALCHKILSGMLSDVRQAYDHVRRDLVRDKIFLMLDKPTFRH